MPDIKFWRDFKRIFQLLKNIVLTLLLWKRPNPTRRIASVSVWQGPSHRPSLASWRRGCSPEGTHIILRQRYVSSLYPQISENWKRIRRILFIPDPKYLYQIPFYLYRIQIYLLPLTVPRICSCRNLFLFILDPKYSYRILQYFIHTGSYFYSYQVWIH